MEKDFITFIKKVDKEIVRTREFWREKDKRNTLADFALILQTQVGQLAESLEDYSLLSGKGTKDPTTESIHIASMAYMIYLKLK